MSVDFCVDAGKLNKRIFLQKYSTAKHAQSGAEIKTWTNVSGYWAQIIMRSARERALQEQVREEVTQELRMRYTPEVLADRRFLIPQNAATLGGDITDSATSLTVSVANIAIDQRQRYYRIGDEFVEITAGWGTTTLTVTRGMFGSTATAHSSGDAVIRMAVAEIDGIQNTGGANAELVCTVKVTDNA